MELNCRKIPNHLRRLRKQMGLSQVEVASLLGIAHTTRIIRWEQGKSIPALHNLFRLSVIYHCYPHELYPELFAKLYEQLHTKTKEVLLTKHFAPIHEQRYQN